MAGLLAGFAAIAVISRDDERCYRALGVSDDRIRVCGNMKFALQQGGPETEREDYRRLLAAEGRTVFLCGSTRSGEEELLLPVYVRLQASCDESLLWVIAPRHLDRLVEVRNMLERAGLRYNLLSRCRQGQARRENIVLVDTMGELAGLYAIGDLNFCGGSLVDKGGHNIMEPVLQGRPVYFGPHMDDFQDAVQLVLTAGAGYQVTDAEELADLALAHLQDDNESTRARQAAARLARTRHEAVQCQLELVHAQLASGRTAKS
jgi:3-deoxy-D-manno-octulosonic-acid transferase